MLHFTSLQFSSVHSIFPVPANWPPELRAYINADRQSTLPGAPDPKKTPRSRWKPLPFGPTVAAHVLLSVCLSNHKRATVADKDMDRAMPQLPPASHTPFSLWRNPRPRPCTPWHCHGRHLINQSINSRFYFVSLLSLFLPCAGLCVIFIIIFIFFFFIILICLFAQPRTPFILFVLAACLFSLSWLFTHFAFCISALTPRHSHLLPTFEGSWLDVFMIGLYEQSLQRPKAGAKLVLRGYRRSRFIRHQFWAKLWRWARDLF